MPGLLYPAYQKFYSALSSLERFNKETNFFDNISAIDSFFTEYRNITFVMQSSLKHTDYFDTYMRNRDKYLTDHWFVDKRNETIKQKPFDLVKEIRITLYLPFGGFTVCEKKYSIENDVSLDLLFAELKQMLSGIDKYEVCFSVSFHFHEAGSDIDLLEKLISGISSMKSFMEAMDNEIRETCPLCDELKEKINEIHLADVPLDFLHVNDYTYYPDQDCFDRAERGCLMMSLDGKKVATHRPLKDITQSKHFNYDGTAFGNFTLSHAIIQNLQVDLDIMPVIMVVYDDETFDLDAFTTDMKTTMYRKINETAHLIEKKNVTEICFLSLYSVMPFEQDPPKTSRERIKQSTHDILVSASIDKELNEKEYVFDRINLKDMRYIVHVMKNKCEKRLNISAVNLFPIRYAFEKKLTSSPDD